MRLASIVRGRLPDGEGSLRSLMLRGAGGMLAVRVASGLVAFASSLALTRTLGVDGFGAYAWALACVSALTLVATLGLDMLLVRESAVFRARSAWDELRALIRRGERVSLLFALALAGVAAAAAGLVGGRLPEHLLVALPALPLLTLAALRAGALQGIQRPSEGLAVTTLLRQVPFLVLLATGLALGGGDIGSLTAVALQVAACAAALAGAAVLLRRALPRDAAVGGGRASTAWLRQSIPMGVSSGLTTLNSQLPLIALGLVVGSAEAGLYAAAVAFTVLFSMLLLAARGPWSPLAARLWATGERERLRRGLTASTRWIGGVSLALGALLALAAEPAMSLFGGEFDEGAGALRLLIVANVVNALAAFNGNTLIMCGEQVAAARSALGATVANVALVAALVPSLEVEGAALAFVGTTLYRNVVNSVQAWRLLGLDTTVLGLRPRAAGTGAGGSPGSG